MKVVMIKVIIIVIVRDESLFGHMGTWSSNQWPNILNNFNSTFFHLIFSLKLTIKDNNISEEKYAND